MREVVAIDHGRALAFFLVRLQDVTEPTVDREELLYNASVLAHYAQVSTHPAADLGAPAGLSAVFDLFVADTTPQQDPLLLEVAGAQCLLLIGFFADQMRARHNIRWYAQLGAGFFGRAARGEPVPRKARVLDGMATRFEPWRQCHAHLARELRDQPYLFLQPGAPSP